MYKRVVSYLDMYENGEKLSGCGFFRMDIKDTECKLSVSIKLPENIIMPMADVCILKREDNRYMARRLDKTSGVNGVVCYRHVCPSDNVIDNISVDDMAGVLVYNSEYKNRLMLGTMNDESINVDEIVIEEPEEENTVYEIDESCKEKVCETIHKEMEVVQQEKILVESKELQENEEIQKNQELHRSEEIQATKEPQEVREQEVMLTDKLDSWQEAVFNKFPKIRIPLEYNIWEAVRLNPYDLAWFPKKYWHLANNKCLVNGYSNYKHIIFARCEMDEGVQYILGIPGYYCTNDAINAKKNGFGQYMQSKCPRRERNTNFGYWCSKVEQ